MFFILSKVLFVLIQPINWVLGLLLFALFTKKPRLRKRMLLWAVVLYIFFTNHLIFNQFAKAWELDTLTADQIQQPYDIGILLGGYSNSQILPNHDRFNFSHRANRFINAYQLYKTGKIKKLLLTGGSGDILQKIPSESVEMQKFLVQIGVPASDIIVEPDSRNTWENAIFTKKILDEQYPNANCLLITSAWHMRRSIGCYEKAGVKFTPYSVDFLSEKDRWAPENSFLPDRAGFYFWEILIKEWVGCIMYKLKGYN
ncbi:MAG: YdcF family protein [Saprospiraceae bacterium]|nr:YdcF family protein [Saprospiraceae bacterium]